MSIFWDFSNYDKIELLPCPIITTGTQDMGNGVYKLAAGTPLKKSTQAVSNDGNADCVVAEDYFFISTKADQSKLVPVITKGYVDKALAEAAWGGTFADAAVSALETAGIFLVDGALETGGGSDLPEVTADDKDKFLHTNASTGALEWAAGGGGGGMKVGISDDPNHANCYVFDKTAGEVFNALESGVLPQLTTATPDGKIFFTNWEAYAYSGVTGYTFETGAGNFYAEAENDYPSTWTDK